MTSDRVAAHAAGTTSEAGYAADAEAAVDAALAKLDLETRVRLLTGADFWNLHPAPAAGLRSIVVSDGPAGVKGGSADHSDTTTSLPSPTALAASWDEDLVAEVGALLAGEARRKGVDVVLGPTINFHRSPLGGRHFEAFSEDPLLTGRLARAYVRGLQANGVGGCPKHYVCNDSETERHTLSVSIDERPLRELYLAPFERVVREAGAWSVMAAYNGVRGTRMTESPLLADPLKETWGFDGVVMSDWFATHSTVESALAALDLVMPGPEGPWGEALLQAVLEGRVPEAAIEAKVRRLLRLAARVGALEGVRPARPHAVRAAQAEVSALVRRVASAGSVLLRNDGLLPLDAGRIHRLALLGPNAASQPGQGGGSSNLRPDYTVSPLEGLRAAFGPDVEILTRAADRHRPGLQTVGAESVLLPPDAGEEAGKPGILVRFLEAGGSGAEREIGRQLRPDGRLDWHGEASLAGRPVVEIGTRFVPDETGRHRIAVSVRGHVTLWAGGRQALDETAMPEKSDVDSMWGTPPRHAVELALVEGQPVDLRIRWEKFYDETAAFIWLLVETPAVSEEAALADAEKLARGADAAIVLLGTTKDDETEGMDRATLSLQPAQDALVRRVAAVNRRTAVVVAAGSPVLMPWRDDVAAVLLTWFPGQEAGNALADVLLGRVEPRGRLPTTWPGATADVPVLDTRPAGGELRYDEGLHIGYRAWLRAGTEPAYPFGHGLGYTEWEYLGVAPDEVQEGPVGTATPAATTPGSATPAGAPAVRVRLRNAGDRPGREVIQLYLSRPDSAIERPVRWLGGFASVDAGPREEVEVIVPVDRWALRHWDPAAAGWAVEPGRFEASVGRSIGDLRLATAIDVRG